MEIKTINFPIDIESRSGWRHLERLLGRQGATAAAFILFRELAYAAEAAPIGVLPDSQVPLFLGVVESWCKSIDPFTVPGGLLTRSEDDSGWFCAIFATHNRHLIPGNLSLPRLGGISRGVKVLATRFEQEAAQQSLLLDEHLFVTPEGKPFTPEETRKVLMLVRLFDNTVGRKERSPRDYTPGLILDAWRVLYRYSEEQIQRVCVWFAARRDSLLHPGLPKTAEQILKDFDIYGKDAKE